MKNNFKITIPIAIILTITAVIYQRSTGPTYPKKFFIEENGQQVKVKLPRSQGGDIDAPIQIPQLNPKTTGIVYWKRYPTNDAWQSIPLTVKNNQLQAALPNQPPAGKLNYYVELDTEGKKFSMGSQNDPIFIRYKGSVPTYILAPHIFFMFFSMFLAVLAALEALKRTETYVLITRMTFGCLVVGGMMLGPLVQKFAFGVYWAGFPYDWDLTDNKLLIGVITWLLAVIFTWKIPRRSIVVAACLVLFGIYSIPHSMQGSEYNYEKGQVETDID